MSFSFKTWYETNKFALSEKRKLRYRMDPVYRAGVQANNAKVREENSRKRSTENSIVEKARLVAFGPKPQWKTFDASSQPAAGQTPGKLLTIGAVAAALGRSIQSVRLYEKQGLIPPAPYRSKKGDRLYPPEMILELHDKLKAMGRTSGEVRVRRDRTTVATVRNDKGVTNKMPLLRVSELARACNRNIATIEHMEADGLFPATPLRVGGASGARLYSGDMIIGARTVFAMLDAGEISRTDVFELVSESWKNVHLFDKSAVIPTKQTEIDNGTQAGSE